MECDPAGRSTAPPYTLSTHTHTRGTRTQSTQLSPTFSLSPPPPSLTIIQAHPLPLALDQGS